MPVRQQISQIIRRSIESVPGIDAAQIDDLCIVDYGKDAAHGDLTTPVAMRVGKMLRQNPRPFAEQIAAALSAEPELKSFVERIEIAGPGFLNIFLERTYWLSLIKTINAEGGRYGRSSIGGRKKVQIEFASANPTGPVSVAHGRQAALGDVLVRIMRFIGFDVTAEYWVNDHGNQIRKLGESVFIRYLQALGNQEEFPEDGYWGEYVKDIGADVAGREGRKYAEMPRDKAIDELGHWAAGQLLQRILKDLAAFGVKHDVLFSQREFETAGHIERLLDRMKQMGLTLEKEGALWMKTSEYGDAEDRVLVKSDGLWTYRLSDIAYHESKFERGFRTVIDMLGPDHHGHILTMQAAMKALGHDISGLKFLVVQHCTFLKDGQKLKVSKRTGQMITLEEVIEDVGVDVTRFVFLTRKTDSHLDFDLDLVKKQSMDNPVYYIQYAHARISSILRKAVEAGRISAADAETGVCLCDDPASLDSLQAPDIALVRHLARFSAVVEKAGVELEPHRLTGYLQELAGEFHVFYTQCPVISDDAKLTAARLELVSATRVVLRNALHLLGVHIPDVM